jgi:hypothetical protein
MEAGEVNIFEALNGIGYPKVAVPNTLRGFHPQSLSSIIDLTGDLSRKSYKIMKQFSFIYVK